jgi:hypothetical protein
MGTSRDELAAQIQAWSLKKHMGMQVKQEDINQVLRMCQSEEDKAFLKKLCWALGLEFSE